MAPWTSFAPTDLLVGYGVDAVFNGTVDLVQVANEVYAVPTSGTGTPLIETISAAILGGSVVAADLTVTP